MFQQIVMFWVEWDSFNSTGAAQTFSTWRKHNSYVQLENFFQKSDSLKRNKSVTKRRKFPTEPSIFFAVCNLYMDFDMLYIFAHVLQNGWIPGERDKCKHGSWPRKKPAKQFKRKSLAETAELTESTIISLAWAGGKKITGSRPRHTWSLDHRKLRSWNLA